MAPAEDPAGRKTTVAEGLAKFNARDYTGSVETLAPGIEWDTTTLLPDGKVYRGRDEVLAYWRDVGDRWEELRIEPDEWIEGGDVVLMLGRLVGRGSGSGAPVQGPWHQVWRFEGDVPVRCENFSDRDRAMEAAGLEKT